MRRSSFRKVLQCIGKYKGGANDHQACDKGNYPQHTQQFPGFMMI